jgi:hypothetical protein
MHDVSDSLFANESTLSSDEIRHIRDGLPALHAGIVALLIRVLTKVKTIIHPLYTSLEDMTRPETVSTLVRQPIASVRLVPFQPVGSSSTQSEFLALETDPVAEPGYVVKRMVQEQDWVMQTTDDRHWRAIAIWQHGVLDRLPAEIDHAIIACAVDGAGRAILLRDVSHALMPDGTPRSSEDTARVLDAMAALHAAFWDDDVLCNPALQLCCQRRLFTHTSPDTITPIAARSTAPVLGMIREGWGLLPRLVDADVVELIRELAHDPGPLCTALERYPHTLVHGDWRPANLGIERGEQRRLILLDWQRPTATVPGADLAYFLAFTANSRSLSREAAIDLYKQRLADRLGARFDLAWWQPQFELSCLGTFVLLGCLQAWFAVHTADADRHRQDRAELAWWSEMVRAGARWLA